MAIFRFLANVVKGIFELLENVPITQKLNALQLVLGALVISVLLRIFFSTKGDN